MIPLMLTQVALDLILGSPSDLLIPDPAPFLTSALLMIWYLASCLLMTLAIPVDQRLGLLFLLVARFNEGL